MPPTDRERVIPMLLDWYSSDPDAGVHAAIAWLLGQAQQGAMPRAFDWEMGDALAGINRDLAAAATEAIGVKGEGEDSLGPFAVIPGGRDAMDVTVPLLLSLLGLAIFGAWRLRRRQTDQH